MNKRRIGSILLKKHQDFLESITEPEIKEILNQHSIISGGALVSLLINRKINDFDYYLDNLEAAYKVADYFCRKFAEQNPSIKNQPKAELNKEEQRVKVYTRSSGAASTFGDDTYAYFENREQNEGRDFIDNVASVVDEADKIEAKHLAKVGPQQKKYRPLFITSNAITLANKIQIVIRFTGSPEEIHKNFDFVHCTNYWTSKDRKVILNPEALESITTRHLSYLGSKYPVCSIIRTRKFLKRGWHINAGQFIKMIWDCNQLNLSSIAVLEDQLTGVDSAYFLEVIRALKRRREESDENFVVDGTYLCSLIDKIF